MAEAAPVMVMPAPAAPSGKYMVCASLLVAVVILIVLVIIWNRQITFWLRSTLYTAAGMLDPGQPMPRYSTRLSIPDEDSADDNVLSSRDIISGKERLDNPGMNKNFGSLPAGQTSDTLLALGYTGQVPWDEVMQASELDPSTFVNHADYVKDVRNYSSGAAFTDKADDNNSFAFTNFIGLRRPEHVEIGASARQQPDISTEPLKRNRPFIF